MEFLQTNGSETGLTVYTFSGENLGDAAADRHIIVGISARGLNTRSLSSVSIGGESATLAKVIVNSVSHSSLAALYIAAVPNGTTGDVVITFNDTMLRCGIGLWRATELASITPTNTASSVANDPTGSLNIVAGGFAIATIYSSSGSSPAAVWTGLTEDYDRFFATANLMSGASDTFESEQTNLTITVETSEKLASAGVFASWEIESATGPVNVKSINGLAIR